MMAAMNLLLAFLLSSLSVSNAFLLDEKCPHCNWNGVCNTVSGQCQCYDGFRGSDCSTDCWCNGHGTCNADSTCQCDTGWKWSAHAQQCVWDCQCMQGTQCIGPGVCGCASTCQYGTCWNGQCECWSGYKGDTCAVYDPNIMPNKNISVGINLEGLSYWSPELKFVDVARESQEWITEHHGDYTWDTHEHDDVTWRDDGYPASLPKTMLVGKLVLRASAGVHAPQGNFTLLYDGEGEVSFKLTRYSIHHNGKGRMVVEFHESTGGIFIRIMRTNPSNPIHNIRLILPGFEDRAELFPFYPPFLENLARYSELRFMDFLHTNNHQPEPTTWQTRRVRTFHTQTGNKGGAIEYTILLANTLGANPWFNQPHAADDNFVRQFAEMVKQDLRPDLKVYVEYSNEVWNGIFRQAQYAQSEGVRLGLETNWKAQMMYYNKRSTEVVDIWSNVFYGSDSARLVSVWAWQTGYQDYTRQALVDLGSRVSHFKALAITGYFSCDQVTYHHNITTMSVSEIAQLCKADIPNTETAFKHYMDVAKNHSLKLLMYEGGPGLESSRTHDDDVTSHAIAFNRHGLMETAVNDVLEAWHTIVTSDPYNGDPGGLFNYFTSVSAYSKYGSWGMLEYTGQDPYTAPKYMAMHRYIDRHFGNTYFGPKCSFLILGQRVYGCFQQRCAFTTNNGDFWSYFPDVPVNGSALVLDGFDLTSHVMFVRSVDSLAVNTYFSIDTSNPGATWNKLAVHDYHRQLAPFWVQRRMPAGSSQPLHLHHVSC